MKKIITALLIVFFAGCSTEDSNVTPLSLLPAETTTGANTFGCLIDGKLFLPRDGTGTFGGSDNAVSIYADPTDNDQYSEIVVRDFKSEKTGKVFIHIQNLAQTGSGNYIVNESNGLGNIDGFNHTYIHCKVFNDATNSYQYYNSFSNSGLLKITYYEFIPYLKLIISGTFNGKVANSNNPLDIIDISNGRFDINGATISNTIFP